VAKLNEVIKARDLQIRDAHVANNELRDESVKNKVLAKDLQFRNEQMVATLKDNEMEIGRLRARLVSPGGGGNFGGPIPVAGGGGNAPGGAAAPGGGIGPIPGGAGGDARLRNVPTDNLEGQIMQTDPASGLVTISIGSDAGLVTGHTLEVFRLSPPKYLGTIRITRTEPNKAVARPISKPLGTLMQGDRVASKINPG
jgi:hypothetical protein